jgi:hypothetical protein
MIVANCLAEPLLEDELVGAIRELTAQVGDTGDRPDHSTMKNYLCPIP